MILKTAAPHFKASYTNTFLRGTIRWPFEEAKLNPHKHMILEEGKHLQAHGGVRVETLSRERHEC